MKKSQAQIACPDSGSGLVLRLSGHVAERSCLLVFEGADGRKD